jgi:two-component sensor histidine kinase
MDSINLLSEIDSISKIHSLKRDDIDALMIEFAKRILASLKIERMSVWLLSESKEELVSMGEYSLISRIFTKNNKLQKSKYPTYFNAVSENNILLVNNVYESPITEELTIDYSLPNNIISLMDIPLRIEGELVGVICYEKTGDKERIFKENEVTLAFSVSLIFASTLEARQRRALQHKLNEEIKQKDLFLTEVHHRVKNNLNIISSLMNLQSGRIKDNYHKNLFEEHRSKIDSIALIHKLVYMSKNVTKINIGDYIKEIAGNLERAYKLDNKKITVEAELDNPVLELDFALPLGLIVNEVITNAFKHAFNKQDVGHILISLKLLNSKLKLIIQDNGSGIVIPENAPVSLGMDILEGLVSQINGIHSFENNQGTIFTLTFSTVV